MSGAAATARRIQGLSMLCIITSILPRGSQAALVADIRSHLRLQLVKGHPRPEPREKARKRDPDGGGVAL